MSGPYRTLLVRPERFESYWLDLERRKTKHRRLPILFFALGMVPTFGVLGSVAIGRASTKEPTPVLETALGEPWGLVVSRDRIDPFVGTHPAAARAPDGEASPIPAAHLQALIATRSSAFQSCYAGASRYVPDLAGDLVVSIALREGKKRIAVGGKQSLRHALGACVERELDALSFPSTHGDVAWVHFPLRFVPAQPPSQGAGNTSM